MVPRRGDWQPLIPSRYRWPIVLLLAATPFVAGVDFALGEPMASATALERSMPVWAWTALLMTAGLLSVVGYVRRWPKVCILGLHLSGVTFFALAAGIAWESVDLHGGFRVPWLYLVIAAASWLAALGYVDQLRGGRR